MGLFNEINAKDKRLLFLVGLLLSIVIYLVALINLKVESEALIQLKLIPIFLGIVYQSRKLSSSWIDIGLKLVISFFISFLLVMISKEPGDKNILITIPLFFVGIFSLVSTFYHEKN